MATNTQSTPHDDPTLVSGAAPHPPTAAEPSLGELFRQLAQDSSTLIRQEMNLAKTEMRHNFRSLAKDMVMLAIGGGLMLVALLALTAFLVAALGDLLGDEYWLGALIVGATYALIGWVMLNKGKKGLQSDDLRPEQTLQSLQADKRWAQAEMQQAKRELTS